MYFLRKKGDVEFFGLLPKKGKKDYPLSQFSNQGYISFALSHFNNEGDFTFLGYQFSNKGSVIFTSSRFFNKGSSGFHGTQFSNALQSSNKGDTEDAVYFTDCIFSGMTKFVSCKFKTKTMFQDITFKTQDQVKFETHDLSNVSFLNTDITRIFFGENTYFGKLESKKTRFNIFDKRKLEDINDLKYMMKKYSKNISRKKTSVKH